MNNFRFEIVNRTEAHTGNAIACLHVMIDSNSNREIADTYIPLDDIQTAMAKSYAQMVIESTKRLFEEQV